MLGDVGLVVLFILIGGVFNAAQIALISLRDGQIRRLAETKGVRGQRLERLLSDPNRFLAAVQIGVTVATMLSSAFGAATIAGRAAATLERGGMASGVAQPVALVVITLIIAFVSLVLGELTPTRLGWQRSEAIALAASGPLTVLAGFFRPVVWLLSKCTNGVVRLLRGDPNVTSAALSQEDLRTAVVSHESLTAVERRMLADVFDAESIDVRQVMVPRPEVVFLPGAMSVSRAARQAMEHEHSRFPVMGRDADEVLGVVRIRDLLARDHPHGRATTVADLATPPAVVPGTKGLLEALHEMRRAGQHLAVVVDEYGGTDGIVTIEDLVEEIVGEMTERRPAATGTPAAEITGDVDGRINLSDFAEATGIALPPGPYDTAAGYLMAVLGRLPREGDTVQVDGRELSVATMDGHRVARIAVGARRAG